MNIIQNLNNHDAVTIVIVILALSFIGGVLLYLINKFVIKPAKIKKDNNDKIKFSVIEDLQRKGIFTQTTKKERKLLVKKAKKDLKKATTDTQLTKNYKRLNKKFSE